LTIVESLLLRVKNENILGMKTGILKTFQTRYFLFNATKHSLYNFRLVKYTYVLNLITQSPVIMANQRQEK
jgi:hypothetical protein